MTTIVSARRMIIPRFTHACVFPPAPAGPLTTHRAPGKRDQSPANCISLLDLARSASGCPEGLWRENPIVRRAICENHVCREMGVWLEATKRGGCRIWMTKLQSQWTIQAARRRTCHLETRVPMSPQGRYLCDASFCSRLPGPPPLSAGSVRGDKM